MGSRDSLGALDSWMNSGFTARSAADGDELFAVDDALLTRLGAPDPAAKRNPFARTLLLIIFAGLTAVFAGRKNGGRGLIAG
ncbi:hypothetical protein [Roseiarcus fermentans]|nr:hypothetical protein [Roseiarcus fermentans]